MMGIRESIIDNNIPKDIENDKIPEGMLSFSVRLSIYFFWIHILLRLLQYSHQKLFISLKPL
jgi:hypothetical protein